jgi:hypothetical protein
MQVEKAKEAIGSMHGFSAPFHRSSLRPVSEPLAKNFIAPYLT